MHMERLVLGLVALGPDGRGSMAVYTSSLKYAATLLGDEVARRLIPVTTMEPGLGRIVLATLGEDRGLHTAPSIDLPWHHVLISEFSSESQYDRLIEMARREPRPLDRLACVAGSGLDFHGFKGRPWTALAGNVHLAVHLTPSRPIERFQIAFTILAALSVVDALDEVPGLRNRSKIKWVNDILVEGAKVAGILAYTQTRATTVTSAVLGIGLNVEATPPVEPTPFVPAVASLRDFLPGQEEDAQGSVFRGLLHAIDRNYRTLLTEGVPPLLERYRERCEGIGEEVTICSEDSDERLKVLATGRWAALGDHLELYLEGFPDPISRGRMISGRLEEEEVPGSSDLSERSGAPDGFGAQAYSGDRVFSGGIRLD